MRHGAGSAAGPGPVLLHGACVASSPGRCPRQGQGLLPARVSHLFPRGKRLKDPTSTTTGTRGRGCARAADGARLMAPEGKLTCPIALGTQHPGPPASSPRCLRCSTCVKVCVCVSACVSVCEGVCQHVCKCICVLHVCAHTPSTESSQS